MPERTDNAATGSTVPEFTISRVFDAPRELVFKAYTEADRLKEWWGPKGFAMKRSTVDLRPGGLFHYCMAGPNDQEMWGKLVFREIIPPERLQFVVSFSDEQGGVTRHPLDANWPLEVLSTTTFTETDGKTTLTMHAVPINASEVERKAFERGRDGFHAGTSASMDQLAEYLRRAQTS